MKKWNSKLIIFLGIVVIGIGIASVNGYRTGISREQPYIIFIPKVLDATNDFWCAVSAGAEMVAKENGAKLEIVAPSLERDVTKQNNLIRESIKKTPDVIVLAPSSFDESLEAAKEIKKAGIKLVLIDSALSEQIQDALIATDNFKAGVKMTHPIVEQIKPDSVIAIISHVKDSSTAMERERGIRAGLGQHQDKILEVLYSDSDYEKAYVITKELLQKQKIDFLFCTNEYSAVGAAKAIKELELGGKVYVVGFDNSIKEMQYLEEGIFEAIVVQKAFNMGYLGIETAIQLAHGEKIEKKTDSGSALILKDDMYEKANQEFLFPFYRK